ncbi:hypothetical protein R80B4_01877 [Fibrobacteres bacterium R8-0-B4]
MLSGDFVTAESAGSYHIRDDYYLESAGFWHGKLAKALKLTGEVKGEAFKDVLRGYKPCCDRQIKLVHNAGEETRCAGCDLTFSAPKTVSTLAYIDPRIQAAFNAALLRSLDYVERDFMLTRIKRNGRTDYEKTDNAIFAVFNHKTSRALDPQVHAHCVLQNITADQTGRCRAMHNIIFENKKLIGQRFRNELAIEIQKLGYGIEITDRTEGLFEINGISKEILDVFSKRSKQLDEGVEGLRKQRYCDITDAQRRKWAVERVGGDDPIRLNAEIKRMKESTELVYPESSHSDYQLAEIAAKETREAKSKVYGRIPSERREDTEKYITEQINEELKAFGTTLEDLHRQALAAAAPPLNNQTPAEAVREAVYKITQNEAAFTREEVLRIALALTLGTHAPDDVASAYDKLIKSGELSPLREAFTPQKGKISLYSTPALRAVESENVNLCRSSKTDIAIDRRTADRYIADTHQKLVDASGFGFTAGQKAALRQIVTSKCQFSVIQGDAGTGKSFAMRYAKELLESHGYKVRGLAPTGKAADELHDAAKLEDSDTIDRVIHKFLNTPEELDIQRGREVFIVDEASMGGSVIINKILKRAKEYDVKVVFVGDRKQFAPVGAGHFFCDLQDKTNVDMTEMKDVVRQKTAQTKDIVKAISEKDIAGAFNHLTGHARLDFDKTIVRNYKTGQILAFGDHAGGVPAGTSAKIAKIEQGELILNYTKNGKEIEVRIDPRKTKRAFTVYGEAEDYKNCITAIPDKEARLQAVADDYINCRSNGTAALVITATNEDRRRLNAAIRKTLVEQKQIENIGEYALLEPRNVSRFNFADAFSVGQLVKGLPQLKVENKFEYGEIVGIDKNRNRLIIRKKTGEDVSVDPSKYAYKPFSVFDRTTTTLGINEKIAFLKNARFTDKITGKNVNVRNGQIATVTALDKDGNATVKTDSGKEINFSLKDYNLLTTAYALSAHKSQGMTTDKIIWHADTAQDVSANSFYVAITRCKYDAAVYTDDVERLQRKASKEQTKYSTIDDDDDIDDEIDTIYEAAYRTRIEAIRAEKAAKTDSKAAETVKTSGASIQAVHAITPGTPPLATAESVPTVKTPGDSIQAATAITPGTPPPAPAAPPLTADAAPPPQTFTPENPAQVRPKPHHKPPSLIKSLFNTAKYFFQDMGIMKQPPPPTYEHTPRIIEKTEEPVRNTLSANRAFGPVSAATPGKLEMERWKQEQQERREQERLQKEIAERNLKMNEMLENINNVLEVSVESATETLARFNNQTKDSLVDIFYDNIKSVFQRECRRGSYQFSDSDANAILTSAKEAAERCRRYWKDREIPAEDGVFPASEMRGRITPGSDGKDDLCGLIVAEKNGGAVKYFVTTRNIKNDPKNLYTIQLKDKPAKYDTLAEAKEELKWNQTAKMVSPCINEMLQKQEKARQELDKQRFAALKEQMLKEVDKKYTGTFNHYELMRDLKCLETAWNNPKEKPRSGYDREYRNMSYNSNSFNDASLKSGDYGIKKIDENQYEIYVRGKDADIPLRRHTGTFDELQKELEKTAIERNIDERVNWYGDGLIPRDQQLSRSITD